MPPSEGAERQARGKPREQAILRAVISLLGDLLAVMRAMRSHLTPEFLALMSGLIHAMRADLQLAGSLWSLFDGDVVARQVVGRAVAREELPAPAATLASLLHEVIEAQIFRQTMTAGEFDDPFAQHVVDDIVLPLLAGSLANSGSPDRGIGPDPATLDAGPE